MSGKFVVLASATDVSETRDCVVANSVVQETKSRYAARCSGSKCMKLSAIAVFIVSCSGRIDGGAS
jgi:hypothetical protein